MKKLAIVFQDFYIISFSIKSNIAILDENQEKIVNGIVEGISQLQETDVIEDVEKYAKVKCKDTLINEKKFNSK